MRLITVLFCFVLCLTFTDATSHFSQGRRQLQTAPWPMEVESLEGECVANKDIFDILHEEAQYLCSSSILRLTPASLCAAEAGNCPPGLHYECPGGLGFHQKLCAANHGVCKRHATKVIIAGLSAAAKMVTKMSKGDLKDAMKFVKTVMKVVKKTNTKVDSVIGKAGQNMFEAKQAFRRLFKENPNMLMEMVEYEFQDRKEKLSEHWDLLDENTRATLLATTCRAEADRALRLVDLEGLKRQLENQALSYREKSAGDAKCFDLFDDEEEEGSTVEFNMGRDCASKVAKLVSYVDPTGLVGFANTLTDYDQCHDINDPNEPKYHPRQPLRDDHPWHRILGNLQSDLIVDYDANTMNTMTPDDRGDGEALLHQLKRKMLSQSCENDVSIRYSKGVCRPMNVVIPEGQPGHEDWAQVLFHDTRSQIVYSMTVSRDQCCDKEGMTTITNEPECFAAFSELELPYSQYKGAINTNSKPFGCVYDVSDDTVAFNSNPTHNGVLGFDEPICKAGDNTFATSWTPIAEVEGYEVGAMGQTCRDATMISTREDCEYALRMFSEKSIELNLMDSRALPPGCSLDKGTTGVFNDVVPPTLDQNSPVYPAWPRDFVWSSSGRPEGYSCLHIHEAADPHTWDDNYLCWDSKKANPHFRWSNDGAIRGMRCTQITEPGDREGTWHDNFLCVDRNSPYHFSWSHWGRIQDKECIQWVEASDTSVWSDNFLCHSAWTPDDCSGKEAFAPLCAVPEHDTMNNHVDVTISGTESIDFAIDCETSTSLTIQAELITPSGRPSNAIISIDGAENPWTTQDLGARVESNWLWQSSPQVTRISQGVHKLTLSRTGGSTLKVRRVRITSGTCSFVEPKKLAYPICHVEDTINFSQFMNHREMQTGCGWAFWIPQCPDGWSENRFSGEGCPWAQDRRVCRQYFHDCEEGYLRMLEEGTLRQRSYCFNGPTQFGDDNTWQGPSIPIVGERTVGQSRLVRL